MSITSLEYIFFIGIGIIVYYMLADKYRSRWLLALSLIFMISSSWFGFLVVVFTSYIVYKSALMIEGGKPDEKRKFLIAAIGICFVILILLKYISPLFPKYVSSTFVSTYIFPVGISYYTLQIVSYMLDVYWGRIEAEKSYHKILLFTCYFPQLVQGPISRYDQLSSELFKKHEFKWTYLKYGIQLMIWGFFKKMVIADRIGTVVNNIFYSGNNAYGVNVIVGLLCYGVQLYCNFSGGIDVIRGVSECFGIGMTENFRQPFFSKSVGEFWRRWHISLGGWMKDYVFYPFSISGLTNKFKKKLKKIVGRKNATKVVMAIANILVFSLVGIWHGLGTNNLGWGLYYGVILAIGVFAEEPCKLMKKKFDIKDSTVTRTFNMIRTFIIVTIGWVFDCSSSVGRALNLFINMFKGERLRVNVIGLSKFEIMIWLFSLILLLAVDVLHEKNVSIRAKLSKRSFIFQMIIWIFIIQMIACFGRVPDAGGFIYENF